MSGIIGSTGSKSGVIGITELDYEEGVWTPTLTSVGGEVSVAQADVGTYTKTGRLVSVQFYLSAATMTGASGFMKVTGLPFAPHNDQTISSSWSSHTMAFDTAKHISMVTNVASFFYWRQTTTGAAWGNMDITSATIYLQASATYQTSD